EKIKQRQIFNMSFQQQLNSLFKAIDEKEESFIKRLADSVAIPSVSAWPEKRGDIIEMINFTKKLLEGVGAETELKENGMQKLSEGKEIPLPPVLFGTLKSKKVDAETILIYGHLDVQPANKEDGWDTDPFKLIIKNGKMFGRGSTDDKGPVIGWINAIEVIHQQKMDIPVNLKFVFEGMEESGSEGLEEILISEKDKFLKDVDYVVISDNYWLGKKTPCITYGLRGICYFFVEVVCAKADLHSGIYGGSVHEGMTDLIHIMASLLDPNTGKIKVEGIYDQVSALKEKEDKLYDNLDFDLKEYETDIGCKHAQHKNNKKKTLQSRWREPSLSLHGIQGAFSGDGSKTVIPAKVTGKFSLRIVPDMEPDDVEEKVKKHCEKVIKDLNSPNEVKVNMGHAGKWWVADINNFNYVSGIEAVKSVFNKMPDMTREGGSIPITLIFQQLTGKNVMLLPMGSSDDGAHSQNEKLNISNYMNGTKVLASYLLHMGRKE
ncbi:hypothetical protein SNEBB_009604, partial [Seison nebaliae]